MSLTLYIDMREVVAAGMITIGVREVRFCSCPGDCRGGVAGTGFGGIVAGRGIFALPSVTDLRVIPW